MLRTAFLFCTLSLFLFSCKKEYTIDDSNGNLTKEFDDNGTTSYEYDLKHLSVAKALSDVMPGSKNLVTKTSFSDGSGAIVFNHAYTFDANNRVSTETITGDTGESVVGTYTYY